MFMVFFDRVFLLWLFHRLNQKLYWTKHMRERLSKPKPR